MSNSMEMSERYMYTVHNTPGRFLQLAVYNRIKLMRRISCASWKIQKLNWGRFNLDACYVTSLIQCDGHMEYGCGT